MWNRPSRPTSPSGGRISLRAAEEGGDAVIEVQDTGTGIPAGVLEHLFQPFLTTKAPGKGTGLGLSSVQAVVEHLGGSIQVRTHAREGTIIHRPVAQGLRAGGPPGVGWKRT